MTIRTRCLPLISALAFATPLLIAQAPRNHLVIAETNGSTDFRYVDPATGAASDVTGGMLGGAASVSIDPSDPNGLYTSAGASFSGPPLWRLDLQGDSWSYAASSNGVVPYFGSLGRVHYSPHGLLLTMSSVSDGLYLASDVSSSVTLLSALSDAQDIAVIGDKVYVNSFESGQPSTIIEYDLVSGTVRTMGTAYPTVRSLGTLGGTLMAGLENGEIHYLDPATDAMALFLAPGVGSVLAIAEGESPMDAYFATENGEVYQLLNPMTPVYTSASLVDIDVSRHQTGQVRYGQGCAGALGVPVMSDTGRPAPGSSYAFAVTGASPNAVSILSLGMQRAELDLGLLGFTGCTLLNDGLVLATTLTDPVGGASTSVAIPNVPSLVGTSVMGQYLVFETGAVPLAASNGMEAVIY